MTTPTVKDRFDHTECPDCRRTIRVKPDGTFARHPDPTFNRTCPASGEPAPKPEPDGAP